MPSADALPECPDCLEVQTRGVPLRPLEKLARITKLEELEPYRERIEWIDSTGVRHIVVPSGVIAEYDVERWHCSYFNHAHCGGYLLEALCARLLSIARRVCGKKYLVGWGAVERDVAVLRQIESERELQRTKPREILIGITALVGQARRILDLLENVKAELPDLHRAMFELATRGRRTVEVEYQKEGPEDQKKMITVRETHTMAGLEFFKRQYGQVKLSELIEHATAYAETGNIEIDRQNYISIGAERAHLEAQAMNLEEWITRATAFWEPRNLGAACYHTFRERWGNVVEISGPTIVIRSSRKVLGLREAI